MAASRPGSLRAARHLQINANTNRVAVASRTAAALEAAEGCRLYLVNRDPTDADRVWVVEVWDSAEHHRASLDLPAVQEIVGRARPSIAGRGDRFELEPIGGLGLP